MGLAKDTPSVSSFSLPLHFLMNTKLGYVGAVILYLSRGTLKTNRIQENTCFGHLVLSSVSIPGNEANTLSPPKCVRLVKLKTGRFESYPKNG